MVSKLLGLIGTGALLALATASFILAWDVAQTQPPMFAIPGSPDAAVADASPDPRLAGRRVRPDVYYQALTDRPLFSPTRRPVSFAEPEPEPEPEPVIAVPSAPAVPVPPVLRVLGVIGSGAGLSALISHNETEADWLTSGDEIDGWTIAEIGPDWIQLSLGPQTFRVEMYQQ